MKNFKKGISIFLLCAMCVSTFASCSPTEEGDDAATTTDAAETQATEDTTAAASKAKAKEASTEAQTAIEALNFENLYSFDENEQPLDRIVTDGGLCTIFQSVAVVGDSFSSGTLEPDPSMQGAWPDSSSYAWIAYMARDCGFKFYNFSRGGLTAREYLASYARQNDCWNEKYKAQVYIIALGCNDMYSDREVGTLDDINEDYTKNPKTFVGDYAQIIQRYKEISPDAFFFLVTQPDQTHLDGKTMDRLRQQNEVIRQMADYFEQAYVIDLYEYAPQYSGEFRERFFLNSHMNPMGYRYTALMMESYIDYYIRKDPAAFYEVGFMDTVYYTLGDKAKK